MENREIKFRAFIAGKMMYEIGVHPFLMLRHHGDNGELMNNDEEGCLTVTPKEKTLSQFTGLHDKNGKEIYEGDIVRNVTDWIVEFNQGCFCGKRVGDIDRPLLMALRGIREIEVIGNIFENPSLLQNN